MNAVDTNLLVYAQDPSDPMKQGAAQDLIRNLPDPALLWQVACEFVAASRKLAGYGFTAERAWRIVSELRRSWPLVLPSATVLAEAEVLMKTRSVSIWDALLVCACREAGVATLYSEDFGDPAPSNLGIAIVNPFQPRP